jgi:hypothetical protein
MNGSWIILKFLTYHDSLMSMLLGLLSGKARCDSTGRPLRCKRFFCVHKCINVMIDVCRSYTIKPVTVAYKPDKKTENAGQRDLVGP